ncbi:MAG TPA: acyl-CoA carboxylase epsilon subunit [Ornithinibacter sp.]|nr:acyl-CoA carboxylase epsilon subunit [Ornithinibacter sp.]
MGPGPVTAESGTTDSGATDAVAPPVAPAIVVRGDATPEQLAALVAVLSAASGGDDPASEHSTSTWAAHSAAMRHAVDHGPGAWRTSLRS